MRRRDVPKALLASAAGSGLLAQSAQAQVCNPPCYARTDAEILANVTPTSDGYAYQPGDVRRYGADYTAIVHALAQAAQPGGIRQVRLAPQVVYNIGANTIDIPSNVSLWMNGAGIVTSAVTGITFGNGAALHGYDGSFIITSGLSGAALKKANSSSNSFYVYGWPVVQAASMGATGSRGLDFTYAYKGVFEIAVEGFETNISGGDGNAAHATYYNELRSPRVRCTDGLIGIQLREGCNSTLISNPQINGAGAATYGLYVDAAGSLNVVGGYIEAFGDQADARGIYLNSVSNATVVGTTLETQTSNTSNYAIGTTGACDNVTFVGCGFAGAWGASNKIMIWGSTGKYTFIGGSPSNHVAHIGQSVFPANEQNGTIRGGRVFTESISLVDGATVPAATPGKAFLYVDTSDGDLKIKFGNGTVRVIATDL